MSVYFLPTSCVRLAVMCLMFLLRRQRAELVQHLSSIVYAWTTNNVTQCSCELCIGFLASALHAWPLRREPVLCILAGRHACCRWNCKVDNHANHWCMESQTGLITELKFQAHRRYSVARVSQTCLIHSSYRSQACCRQWEDQTALRKQKSFWKSADTSYPWSVCLLLQSLQYTRTAIQEQSPDLTLRSQRNLAPVFS